MTGPAELLRQAASDLRRASRSISRHPSLSLAIVACFTLGIGASTAVFSLFFGILYSPIPYPDGDRLVVVWGRLPEAGKPRVPLSVDEFWDVRTSMRGLERVTAAMPHAVNLTGSGPPERLTAARVTADFFPLLGLPLVLGTSWQPENDLAGNHRFAVLSDSLWRSRFNADPRVVGRNLSFDGEDHTVLGVAPPELRFEIGGADPALWVPLNVDPADKPPRQFRFLRVYARRPTGVDVSAAATELAAFSSALREQHPEAYASAPGWELRPVPLIAELTEEARPALWVLFGTVMLLLAAATANIANLLLARAEGRRQDVAVQQALGAPRSRLARQYLAESVVLALPGSLLGLLLAIVSLRGLFALGTHLPRVDHVALGAPVLVFSLAATLAVALVVGFAPLALGLRFDLRRDLTSRDERSGRLGRVLREGLVVAEVAVMVILLVAAGVVIRSFLNLRQVDLGFVPQGVLTTDMLFSPSRYPDEERQAAYTAQIVARVRAMPGVTHAAIASTLPLAPVRVTLGVEAVGRAGPEAEVAADWRAVTPDYFGTLRVPLLAGRVFSAVDHERSARVAIVDQRLAERLWPPGEAVGKAVRVEHLDEEATVIGVVGHVKSYGVDVEAPEQLYTPFAQTPLHFATLALRTSGDPMSLGPPLRHAVWSVDDEQPLAELRLLAVTVEDSLLGARTYALVLGVFATVTLLLAVLGIYSVLSFLVAQRFRRFAILLAIGAPRAAVRGQVVRQALGWSAAGALVGVAVVWALRRFLAGLVFGVAETDPATVAAAVVVAMTTGLVASLVPVRRALRVDPVEALRGE